MGVDGIQYLYIRGSKECLDEIELQGLWTNSQHITHSLDHDSPRPYIFKTKNVERILRTPHHLAYRLLFRNEPIYEQLELLLNKYSKCWIKNDYATENGECGLWIGRFQDGKPQIHTREWQELTAEEILFVTNFSK